MSGARYRAIQGAPGFGWHVQRRAGDVHTIVAGPFTTREQAQREATLRESYGDAWRARLPVRDLHEPAPTFEQRVTRALELSGERYDHELDELRGYVAALGIRVAAIETTVYDHDEHSRRAS